MVHFSGNFDEAPGKRKSKVLGENVRAMQLYMSHLQLSGCEINKNVVLKICFCIFLDNWTVDSAFENEIYRKLHYCLIKRKQIDKKKDHLDCSGITKERKQDL